MATPLNNICVGRIAYKHLTFLGFTQPFKSLVVANACQTQFTSACSLHSASRKVFQLLKAHPSSLTSSSNQTQNVNNSNICGQKKGLLSTLQSPSFQPVRHKAQLHRKRITPKQKKHAIIKKLVGARYEYSGDLRQIKDFPEDEVLYPFKAFEDELKNDEVLKKLASLEFASDEQKYEHKKQLVLDRIIALFGQDSELEQRIAEDTLFIRSKIPEVIRDYYVRKPRNPKKYKQFMVYFRILQRREDLAYLRKVDHERFEWLLRELKIRYVIPKDGEPIFTKIRDVTREETLNQAAAEKRKKLEELKAQFAKEKEAFYEYKARVLSEMDRDLESYGLTRAHLKAMIEEDKERDNPREWKEISWEDRVQLGITGKLNKLI